MQNSDSTSPFLKGPKRKRLAKACDACHKSKRRCDGTAPCSNCYYASKQCTYTDASGRPVPAPRPFKPEKQDPQPSSSSADSRGYQASQIATTSSNQLRIYPTSHHFQNDNSDDEHKHTRKRFRNERGNPMPVDDLIIDGPLSGASVEQPSAIELDPALTRELTNLFFTHCHPARVIIHKPTFSSALSHNRVPSHLLLAVCALAAPLSKQPRIRTTPSRFAGKPFAQEALSQMFDGAGRLVVEPDLAAAQALCILQMHDILTEERNSIWSSRFHDLALQIVEGLGVHSPEHPTLTPVPSQEFVQRAIEREAVRRIFWFIHLLDVMASIYFKKPVTFADNELRLRLPVDETSFELGVHSTLPEYLYLPAVRTQYASEFGHLIRIISIYAKMEFALDEITDTETNSMSAGALMEAEQRMEEWDRTLPDHLRFSEESLQVQQSMFETSSNGGAWCWCCIHLYHASCALVLHLARQRIQRLSSKADREPLWAVERIELILQMLGDRAKNSILMGSALWSLIKYCKRDDPQIRKWASEYEDAYGTQMFEMVQDWRSQPSPPQLHQYPHSPPVSYPLGRAPTSASSSNSTISSSNTASTRSLGLGQAHMPGGLGDANSLSGGTAGGSSSGHIAGGRDARGSGSGTAGQRGFAAIGDGVQSLPSLKASGLLDSWGSASRAVVGASDASQKAAPPPPTQHQRAQPRRMSTSGSMHLSMLASSSDVAEMRPPTTLGMPVGLQWLANESR
ncbi:hypothetical protein BDN70DRAFT_847808 [Pholiota conissans]|uniref:Zn(2)-C6 fungal-type domain-containing protein n=1 Tax=Pholiota conissans TaxID=109636 RepID=A0A9P6D7A7_9AGAR|nr:hypothetical protein BDN70DRAFT_847808 [Pholiota conissans]